MTESKQKRRAEIVSAATKVFAEKGYHTASINDVIEKAGIARGTFYLYFSGKHNVLEAILDDVLERLRSRIKGVETGSDAPPFGEQLRANIIRVIRFATEEREVVRLVLAHGLAPNDEIAERVANFWRHVAIMIESSLTEGMTLGIVRKCDVKINAAASLGAIRGVVEFLVEQENHDEADLARTAGEVIAFAMRGLISIGS